MQSRPTMAIRVSSTKVRNIFYFHSYIRDKSRVAFALPDSFPDLSPSHVKPLRGFAEKCAIGLFLISLIDDAAAVLVRPSNSLFCLDNTFFQSLSCQIMILKAIAAPPNDRFLFIQAVFCAACTNDRTMEFTKPVCSALPLEPSEVSIDPLVAEFKHNYASH